MSRIISHCLTLTHLPLGEMAAISQIWTNADLIHWRILYQLNSTQLKGFYFHKYTLLISTT